MERKKLIEDEGELLWELTWENVDEPISEYFHAVNYLCKSDAELTIPGLIGLQKYLIRDYDCLNLPASVAVFFDELVRQKNPSKVLDPIGGLGLLGAYLSLNENIKQIDVMNQLKEAGELIDPLNLPRFKLHTDIINLQPPYDAIVAIPPYEEQKNGHFGMLKGNKYFSSADGDQIKIIDDYSALLIAGNAQRLSPDGFIAFVMPPEFKMDSRKFSLRKNLERLGLHLSALLSFKPGIFSDIKIAFELAIFERKKQDKLFVAEIPEDEKAQKELITRLWARKGGAISQGRLICENEFHSLPALEAKERAAKLANEKKLDPHPFNEVVKKIRDPISIKEPVVIDFAANDEKLDYIPYIHVEVFGRFADHPDAVYLPISLPAPVRQDNIPVSAGTIDLPITLPATVRQDDLPKGTYFQLVVNTKVVLPDYLAFMLNTDVGHAVRKSTITDAAKSEINKMLLKDSKLYLPSLDEQHKTLDVMSKIQSFGYEFMEQPHKASTIIESFRSVKQEDIFKEWVETLPFPLALILRTYDATDSTENEKCQRLLKFFEAFAEFFATIHLSAFKSDTFFWESKKRELFKDKNAPDFIQPTFGKWNQIVAKLTKEVRSMTKCKSKDQPLIKSLYATNDNITLNMLASEDIYNVLNATTELRNEDAHGGIKDYYPNAKEEHESLKKKLKELRDIVGNHFLKYKLIVPIKARTPKGFHKYEDAWCAMGSNMVLERIHVKLATSATSDTLNMYSPDYDKVLELLPFVILREAPLHPAGYFYTGTYKEKKKIGEKQKFVSYTLTDSDSILLDIPKQPIINLINEFKNKSGELQ